MRLQGRRGPCRYVPLLQLEPNARALDLARAAALLAAEASALGTALCDHDGHRRNPAAARAAAQAEEAVALVARLEAEGQWNDAIHAATWALSASAVALSVARDSAGTAGARATIAR